MKGESKKPKRRWWQRLYRAASLAAVLLLAAYVTLPWWLPANLVRDWLARELSRQAGVPVTIGRMAVSWRDGVEIRDLRIASPEGFATPIVLDAPVVRAEFSPLNFLVYRRMSWLDVEGPKVFAEFDREGNTNVEILQRMDSDVQPEQVSVRSAVVLVRLAGQDRPLRLDVGDLQMLSGRTKSLERLSLSARLAQTGAVAPVSLMMSAGAPESEVAATATLQFANLDLAQLPLIALLNLPLEHFQGRCGGSIDLQLNRRAVVDRFSVNLRMRGLDVQPVDGPRLPVIDEAGVRISASFDPLAAGGGELSVQSASVRVPGLDLAGQARLSLSAFGGHWESIQMLSLKGVVQPTRLAALLTGRGELPMGVAMDGPVRAECELSREGPTAGFVFSADATDAAVRRDGDVLKPAGRALTVRLAGAFDRREWKLVTDHSEFVLGGNRLQGRGTLHNFREMVSHWRKAHTSMPPGDLLADLARLDWRGEWELADLDALRDLLGPAAAPLRDVNLKGRANGRVFLERQAGAHLHVMVNVPAESELSVGAIFRKPPATPAGARLDCAIDVDRRLLTDMDMDLAVGEGRLSIDRAEVRFEPGDRQEGSEPAVHAGGLFGVDRVEDVLRCLPGETMRNAAARGAVEGRWRLALGPGQGRADVSAEFKEARLVWSDWLDKPTGQPAAVACEVAWGGVQPGLRIAGEWKCAAARATGAVVFAGETVSAKLDADVARAGWLTEVSPLLAKLLGDDNIAGAMRLGGSGQWDGRAARFDVACDADAMEYASARPVHRVKAAGVPMGASATGRIVPGEGRAWRIEWVRADLRLAGSKVSLAGEAELDLARRRPAEQPWAPVAIERLDATIDARLAFGRDLSELVPELEDAMARHALSGAAALKATVRADCERIAVQGQAASDGLAMTLGRGVRVPADLAARAEFELTAPADLRSAQLNHLRATAGDAGVLADGKATFRVGADGLPTALTAAESHLHAWTTDASTLCRLAPDLERYAPAGRASVELEWAGGESGEIKYLEFRAEDLRGRYRGKDISVGGALLAERVRLEDDRLSARRVTTDGLDLRAGDNRVRLVADLSDVPARARGSAWLLGEFVDNKDLGDWLMPPPATTSRAAKLSDADSDALRKSADAWIAQAKEFLVAAELDLRFRLDRVNAYDATVAQTYDVRRVVGQLDVRQGAAKLGYVGAVCGGIARSDIAVNLKDATPMVAVSGSLSDLIATESIQPQIAQFFPGNTVQGYFNRREQVQYPLRDALCRALDPRWPLRPAGEAKTVTIDGLLRGRAAPRFVANLFPGLNLAEYPYQRMTGFTEFRADGTAENDMIFSGKTYDIYIEGTTDADNIGRYEIGLILLGSPQTPEMNHRYRPGRIPILKWKARIEGGRLYDEEVSYPWPNETLGVVFLKNNLFYRIWLNAKKP